MESIVKNIYILILPCFVFSVRVRKCSALIILWESQKTAVTTEHDLIKLGLNKVNIKWYTIACKYLQIMFQKNHCTNEIPLCGWDCLRGLVFLCIILIKWKSKEKAKITFDLEELTIPCWISHELKNSGALSNSVRKLNSF